MPLPNPRAGTELKILGRKLDYSFWPMGRTTRRFGLQSRVFATDPWSIIRHSIDKRCPAVSKSQAHAFQAQSRDYFRAAEVADLFTTKPVLLYYSFLNLAKAFALTSGERTGYAAARHGLSERLQPATGQDPVDSVLDAFPSAPQNINVFDDFLISLRGSGLQNSTAYQVTAVLPQILQGHRLWCAASRQGERFIEVGRIDLLQNSAARTIWLVLNIFEDDLTRLGIAHNRVLPGAGLVGRLREVSSDESVRGRRLLKFEQVNDLPYKHRPSDQIPALVNTIKHFLWSNVLSIPPYRKYYVYVSPAAERPFVLPQLASIFALFYYLGSVTRYRPQKISGMLTGNFGAQLEECVVNLPKQFLYLLTSEFARQDVTRAAII